MLSVIPRLGGFRSIMEENKTVALIDFDGDLSFLGEPTSSRKAEIISFLKENKIPFNK